MRERTRSTLAMNGLQRRKALRTRVDSPESHRAAHLLPPEAEPPRGLPRHRQQTSERRPRVLPGWPSPTGARSGVLAHKWSTVPHRLDHARCVTIRQRADFSLGGPDADFDPALLTAMLGIDPTSAHRRGEARGPSGRPAKSSAWELRGDYSDDYDSEALVLGLLDVVEPVSGKIAEARQRWGLECGVSLVVHIYAESDVDHDGPLELGFTAPGLGFEASTIARLAALGAWLDVDQYIYDSRDDGMDEDSPLRTKP